MFLVCKVFHPLRCGETAVFDDHGGHCDEGCHGHSDRVDGDAGAQCFHLYFCPCHQTLCTYNTRTQEYELL